MQYGGRQLKFAAVGLEAELDVGFHGVEALVLQLIGFEFRHQADAAALLLLIEQNAGASLGDFAQGKLELQAAVAAQRVEDVSGEALGVNAHERRRGVDVAHDQRDRSFHLPVRHGRTVLAGHRIFDDALKAENAEVSPASGEVGVGHLTNAGKWHTFHSIWNERLFVVERSGMKRPGMERPASNRCE